MNAIFPCGVLLSVIIVCWASTTSNLLNGENGAVEQLLHETAQQHIERFHRLHGRSKRFDQRDRLIRDEGELWLLNGFNHSRGCPGVLLQFQVFEIDELLFAITVTHEEENNVHIHRFSLEKGCYELLTKLPTGMALDFQLNIVNQGIRLIVIEKFTPRTLKHFGSQVFTLAISNNTLEAQKAEVLFSEHPSCVTSWSQNGIPHVAICNAMVDNSGVLSYAGKSHIYCASGGYYDLCDDINTHNPQQVHYFGIFSWHFLAVANHPNATEGEDVPVEIFRYDLNKESYFSYQNITGKGAVDICSLTLGSGFHEEHYLVVVNQYTFDKHGEKNYDVSSYIYKFVENKFEPFQAIPTRKATGCLTYKTGKDKLILMFADAIGANSYQYDGWRFVPVTMYTQHAMGPGLQKLKTSTIDHQQYIAASNVNAELDTSSNLFLPLFKSQLTLSDAYDETMRWCSDYKKKLDSGPIKSMIDVYPNAIRKDDTDITLGAVDFGKIAADHVQADELTIESEKIRVGLPMVREFQDIHIKIADLIDKLSELSEKQQNAIRSEGDYVINGKVFVNSLSSTCTGECQVPIVNAGRINGEDMNNFLNQSVRLSDKSIPSVLHFSSLIVNGTVDTPVLSDRKVDNYVQTDQDLNFTETFKVDGNLSFAKNLDVDGSINHKKISPETLLLRDGEQTLDWELIANNIQVPQLKVSTINDRNVSFFYDNALSARSNFKLVRPKFATLTARNLTLTGFVNQIDINDLFQNAMRLEGDQNITGSHWYNSTTMGSVTVRGEVNGQKFPDARFISISDTKNVVNLPTLRLKGAPSNFSTLNVTKNFAGLQIKDGRLDTGLLLQNRNETQFITGKKSFVAAITAGNVTSGTVNNKPTPLFNTNSSIYGDPGHVLTYHGLNISGHVTFEQPLNVNALLGIDLDRVKKSGVQLNTTKFPSFDSITFNGDVIVAGDLSAKTINSVPRDDFLTDDTTGPLVFSGRKSFQNVSLSKPFELNSLLNGHNLSDVWNNTLHMDGNQTIHGKLTINNDTRAVILTAGETQFFPLKNVGQVGGIKHFGPVKIEGSLKADSIETAGTVGGVDIRSWPRDTLLKDGNNQTVTGRKFFAKLNATNVTVEGSDNFDVGIFADIIKTNGSAVINGNLTVRGSFTGLHSVINGTLDGQESNLPLFLLRYGADQILSGDVVVKGPLKVDAFYDKSWTINGVNISQLLDDTIKTDQAANLSVPFGSVVVDNINVGGLIQGHNFPDDFVRRSANKSQVVQGLKRFAGSVRSHTLQVANLINGEDPSKLCETEPLQQSRKWIVHGDVIVEKEAGIDVDKINHVELDELHGHVWLNDKPVKLEHNQIFDDVSITGSLEANGFVNGIDLADLKRRAVLLNDQKPVSAVHHFAKLTASKLKADDFEGDSVSGISLKDLKESVLLRNVPQDIHNNITFQDVVIGNVVVSGTVNDFDLDKDMMMKDRANVVIGHKILDKIIVEGNVTVCENCTIGGVNVSHWGANAVLRTGNFTVSAPVHFDQVKFERPLTLEGKLDGVKFDRDHLMTLNDDQEIRGNLTLSAKPPSSIFRDSDLRDAHHNSTEGFKLSARIKNLTVNGSYSGVNLTHFFDKAVHQNMELTFTEPVSLTSLEAAEAIDKSTNSTIRDILQGPEATEIHLADLMHVQPVKRSEIDELLENINRLIPNIAIELQHFKEVENDLPLVTDADKIYVIQQSDKERPTVCYYNNKQMQLYCGSAEEPLLSNVLVTSVAASTDGNFAVTYVDMSGAAGAKIYSNVDQSYQVVQDINVFNDSISTAVTIKDKSCFLFADSSSVNVYCRSAGSPDQYEQTQSLSLTDVRQMSVCYQNDGAPILAIRSGSQQSRVVILQPEGNDSFRPVKALVTPRIVSMDCACDENQCFIATLSPSKPAAIPGDVMIWSLNNIEQPVRKQRITISEPTDVKFAMLPDGRLALAILQPSGIHNVLFYVWEGQSLFAHKTTANVPGVKDMDLVYSIAQRQLLMILTVKTPVTDLAHKHSVRLFEGQFIGIKDT